MRGKYIARPGGYLHIREDGSGRFLRELPEGVHAADIVDQDLNVEPTPLQTRLGVLQAMLRDSRQARDAAFASDIAAILAACTTQYDRDLVAELRARALEPTDFLLSGQADNAIASAQDFFSSFAERLRVMSQGMLGDGALRACWGILGYLPFAMAEVAPDGVARLVACTGFIAGLAGATSVEMIARALCIHAVHKGCGAALSSMVEHYKTEGDLRTQQALDGSWSGFYVSLHRAAPCEMAVSIATSAVRELLGHGDGQRRWARLGINAEERALRIEGSLQWSLINLDGRGLAYHRQHIRQLQRTHGARAARLEALDMTENRLLYPREMLPAILRADSE